MTRLRLTLLGGFRAKLEPGSPLTLKQKKVQALLAFLATPPGRTHSRDALVALLWGDVGDEQARHSLRQALHDLRQSLPPRARGALVAGGDGVALDARLVDVDVAAFERLAARRDATAWQEAAALYGGDFLAGLAVREAAFEEWLRTQRDRLREVASKTLSQLLARQQHAEAIGDAIDTAMRLLALDPLQEGAHRALMRLYVRQGRRAAALRQYQICVDLLQRELGVEPETATRELYQELLQDRAPATAPSRAQAAPPRARPPGQRRRPRPVLAFEAPLVGRDAERLRAEQLLIQARRGHGALALVIGEAGVGKSRLVEEIAALARRRRALVLVGRGYEAAQVLSFGPWIDALRGELDAVRAAVARLHPAWRSELVRLLPELDVPEPASATTDPTRLFEAVTRLIGEMAARTPIVLVLEDLHWADEMTVRLLALLGRRLEGWRALVVGTVREEELAEAPLLARTLDELRGESRCVWMPLLPLSREDTAVLARALTSKDGLDPERDAQLWSASEGNPLVVIETLRAARDGAVDPQSAALPLPKRIQDLVTSRLDRLSHAARRAVEIASVIGREFDFALLQHAAGLGDREAAAVVEELVRRRLLHGVGLRLDFTHDRVREAVRRQLVAPQRRLLHRLVAGSIEAVFRDDLESHYAALATHAREGDVRDKALMYLGRAAAQAMTRSAYRQAVAFLEEALDLVRAAPEGRDRLQRELDLQTSLGRALMSTKGYAAPEVERAYARARELCGQLGDGRELYPVVQGVWLFHFVRADLASADALARQLLSQAHDAHDPALVMEAHRALGTTLCFTGDPGSARTHLEAGLALYDRERHRAHALRYGQDSGVTLLSYLAWVLWLLGYPEQARTRTEEALALARSLGHPFTLAFALNWAACLHRFRRDRSATRATAEAVVAVATDHGFPQRAATGAMLIGWARADDPATRIAIIEEGLRAFEATGAKVGRQHYLALLAEAHADAGRPDDARAVVRQALETVHSGERLYEAELYRLDGELLLAGSAGATDQAEGRFRTAVEVAVAQRAKSLELRAATGLARLLAARGRAEEARATLSPVAAWFTEGLDTADSAEARAVLARL